MHDFCFTLPYGFVILVGGLIGFLRKGSTSSLLGGAGSGVLLLVAGKLSLSAYHKGRNSWFAIILETVVIREVNTDIRPTLWLLYMSVTTVVSLAVTIVMGQRYKTTGKFMPPGLVFFIGFKSKGAVAHPAKARISSGHIKGVMTMFYFYKIATGGNHIVQKDKPS